ncbi:heterokaryon incompatibility protein-domain-containing protein [Pestalotiopsis sp. NC0098]|nr:heterokaryon incompatibility protein-domain-containing protein [Pestalotiopsis sp. NC0098]
MSSFDTYNESVPNGERLWLTKRPSGAPGLSVLAKDSRRPKNVHVLAVVAFSVTASNPAAHVIQLRPPELDSGSVHSLNFAAEFLKKCRDQHDGCHPGESPLPSRVLDTDLSDGMVKLIEPHGQSGQYACLSYCWGGVDTFVTTQSTIGSRRSGFDVSQLPKTLSDAVKTVRHLGIRYLWVDSLCICQDDPEDWARESSRMADVYSNAYLVIAANRSADASGGCFHSRTAQSSCQVELPGYADNVHVRFVFISDEIDWDQAGFPDEPLSKRAWGLQERVLARRVLHFNSRQLYYECDEGIVSEDGSRQVRPHGNLPRLNQSMVQTEGKDPHTLWYSLLWGVRTP